jgi:plastocyanin
MSQEQIMKKSIFAGRGAGSVFSLIVVAMLAPEAVLAGPGCMKNQPMAGGYYPYSSPGPQPGYTQRMPYRYNPAAGVHPGMMPVPYNRPMHAWPGRPGTVTAQTQQSDPGNAQGDNNASGESITVRISGMRFEPEHITVKPGTTVTWVHEGPMPHTINGNADGLGSGTLYNGQTYSHTFEKDGLFNYYCGIHPSMTGSVVVEEVAADS